MDKDLFLKRGRVFLLVDTYMNWYKRTFSARYMGQCDRMRIDEATDALWRDMMAKASPITLEQFKAATDASEILDDKDPEDSIEGFLSSDPEAGAYESYWGAKKVYFLQTSGFEFIWSL